MIGSLRNLLQPAMAIDGHRATYIVAQHISMNSLHNLVRPAMAIDGDVSRSDLLWWTMPIDWQQPQSIVLRRETWEQTKKYNRPRCAVCCHGLLGAEKWWSSLWVLERHFVQKAVSPWTIMPPSTADGACSVGGRTPRVFRHDQSRKEKFYPK